VQDRCLSLDETDRQSKTATADPATHPFLTGNVLFAWKTAPAALRAFDRATARQRITRNGRMKLLSLSYRCLSNFVFLALVYYSLNFMEKYDQRAIVAILVLVYAAMRAATALRSFYFFQRIERLELEARRLSGLVGNGPQASAARKQIVNDVGVLRQGGEMNSYVDLLFLSIIVLLCVSKIVTN
jgi:hypothetical protein